MIWIDQKQCYFGKCALKSHSFPQMSMLILRRLLDYGRGSLICGNVWFFGRPEAMLWLVLSFVFILFCCLGVNNYYTSPLTCYIIK